MDPDKPQGQQEPSKLIVNGFKQPSSTNSKHDNRTSPTPQSSHVGPEWQEYINPRIQALKNVWQNAQSSISSDSTLTTHQQRIQRLLLLVALYLGIVGLFIFLATPEGTLYFNHGEVDNQGFYSTTFQLYSFWCFVYSQLAFSFAVAAYIAARAAYTLRAIIPSINMLLFMSVIHIVVSFVMLVTDVWTTQMSEYLAYIIYWALLAGILIWIKQQHAKGAV